MEGISDDTRTLHRTMRDLVALSALPAVWAGYQPRQVAEGLVDALLSTLRLDLVYLHLPGQKAGQEIEIARTAGRPAAADETRNIGRALAPCLDGDAADSATPILNSAGGVTMRPVVVRIGGAGQDGVLVVGAQHTGFPSEADRLLLTVGANQAAVVLQRQRAEEALRASEERFRFLVQNSSDIVSLFDAEGTILYQSPSIERLLGHPPRDRVGQNVFRHPIVHPDDLGAKRAFFEAILKRPGVSVTAEFRLGHADGSWRDIEAIGQNFLQDPNVAGIVANYRDVTERKQDQALLDGQKQILELIIQGEPLGRVLTVLCRTIERLAQGEMLASVLLLDADGVHVRHGAAPSLPESYNRAIDGLAIGPSAGSCGTAAYRREPVYVSDIASDPLWVSYAELALSHGLRACWSSPILSSTGGVLGTFAVYCRRPRTPTPRDLRTVDIVTRTVAIAIEQSRAGQALRESEERFRTLAKATNDAVWDWELNSDKVWWNEGVFTLFGYVLEQNQADPAWWLERVHPDDREAVESFFFGVVHGRELSWVDEYRFRCADGSYKDVYDRGYVIRDAEGRALRMIGAMLDITARKRAEEALRESEYRWRSLAEALPQFVWTARPDGFMDYGSAQIQKYMGCPESDVLGWGWLDMLHPDDRDRTQQAWQAAVEEQQSAYEIEHRFRRFDGAYRWFKTRGVAVTDSEGNGYKWFGTCTDITTDKQLEDELRLANERLHLAVRGSNIAIWENDMPDGDFQRGRRHYVNAWEQLGYERSEFPPDPPPMSDARVHPDDRAAVQEAIRRYLAGDTDKFELEHRLRHKDGSYRWMLTRGVAARDAAGKPIRFVGSAIDITDRRRLEEELRRAKEAAEAANRAKDEFLANVSHEIRTPMNAILGMTELVLDTPLADDQRQSLKTVKSAADNLLGIINDLLDFSKIEAGKLELEAGNFSLRAAVGDTLRALAVRAHRKGLELVCNVQHDVPDALIGDAGRLRQVLLNLIGNAIKFTERGDVVVEVDVAGPASGADVSVRFTVRDTGIGIPPKKQSTIFRAFEQEDTSTTRKYGGTGLGLTISAQLVALMGGNIAVESQVGRGSTFSFTARYGRQAHQTAAGAHAPPILLRNLRVLVVDDNAANRHIMEQWLHAWQMDPTSVGDAMAAMDALWHGVAVGRPHALLLLDARMPDTDGLTLAAKIRERAELSGSRIILLTSGDRPGNSERSRELRVDAQLLKPVQQDELLETIYSIMSRRSVDGAGSARPRPSPDSAPVALPAVAPLRVLVAEDSEFNAQLMEKLLVKRGHTVRVVSDGRKALTQANAGEFDLLFLDLHMPELDGFEVIRSIREHERATRAHLPVIALTARSRKEDREHCLTAGMDAFLSKPIQTDDLWATIDRVVHGMGVPALTDPPASPGPRLVDPRVLLAACGGDAAILKGICDMLRGRLPSYLAAVREAFQDHDAPRLREAAHKMFGMVAAFSTAAGAVVSDIEDHAARGQLEEAATLIEQLTTIARQLPRVVDDLSIESLRREAGTRDDLDGS